jgi:hypothetical protein
VEATEQLTFMAKLIYFKKAGWGQVPGANTKAKLEPRWHMNDNKVCAVCSRYHHEQFDWVKSVERMIIVKRTRKDEQGRRRLWYSWLCRRCWLLLKGEEDDHLTDHLLTAYIPPNAGTNK